MSKTNKNTFLSTFVEKMEYLVGRQILILFFLFLPIDTGQESDFKQYLSKKSNKSLG